MLIVRAQPVLQPQLLELRDQLKVASAAATELVEGLSYEQMKQRPRLGAWSVAECLVHLNLTSTAYLPILTVAIENAYLDRIHGQGPFRMDYKGRILKWMCEQHGRFKVTTSPEFRPTAVEPVESVLKEFLTLQDYLAESLQRANGIAIDRLRVVSPFDSRVKYNVFSRFQILAAHQRRHLWQANESRRAILALTGSAFDC